jgi:Mn-containing catalase
VYERLIDHTEDPDTIDALQFLMTREITHMKAFSAALESMEKPPFSIGRLAPTPGLVDEFFNASTGEGDEGDPDVDGPWRTMFGLNSVESNLVDGDGLSIDEVDGVVGPEERGKQDDAEKTTTAPEVEELIGVAAAKY